MRLFTAAILSTAFAAMCGPLSAQDDLRPLVDIASQEASEDIPPPAPVPDESLASPTVTNQTTPGDEMNAYDFGISYESTATGLRVSAVIVDSLAANSGVQPGDMIVAVNGRSPSGDPIMQNQVQSLTVLRNGNRKSISIGGGGASPRTTVMSAPDARRATSTSAPSTAYYAPRRTVAYSVPRTTYSAPARSYRYAPSYDTRYAPSPAVVYRSSPRYSYGYSRRPAVSIGIGTGGYRGVGVGYGGFGPGFGPGFGYGPSRYGGFGGPSFGRYGGFGPGLSRGGRSGFSISFGF